VASLALYESRVTPSDNDALKITWPVVRGGFLRSEPTVAGMISSRISPAED